MNIELARSQDSGRVRSIVSHPEIRELVCEGELSVPMHKDIYYLVPTTDRYADGALEEVALGVVAFVPLNSITWNPHIAILPEHRGCGTEVMRTAVAWMFENTACRKIAAFPPVFNAAMIRVFEKCGFRREGVSEKSFSWHGVIYDRLMMGIEKECH